MRFYMVDFMIEREVFNKRLNGDAAKLNMYYLMVIYTCEEYEQIILSIY